MASYGLIERLQSTADKCRHQGATASDPEAARTLLQLADDMDAAIASLKPKAERPTSKSD